MKTLREPDKTAAITFGPQKEEFGREYVFSKYLVREGDAVLNTLTGEAILLNDDADRAELIKRWFLVPSDMDVKTLSDLLRQVQLSRNKRSNGKTNYVIFTTTACNAACTYCFEKGYQVFNMSEDVANRVGDYIIRTHDPNSKTSIKWFGGEPLLNKKAINTISSIINNEVDFTSSISTNGDLLNTCSNEELKMWNLKVAQFTLDDIGENYCRIKGLGSDAYATLIKNVERLDSLGIRANLRIHYNKELGADPCFRIIDAFKDYKNVTMYCHMVYGDDSVEDYKNILAIDDKIISLKKKRISLPKLGNHCMADNQRIACITPTGELSPCEHYAYGPHIYGSINSRHINMNTLKPWTTREKHIAADCRNCLLYPTCNKIALCPAEGECTEGYRYYKIETIKRALRKKVSELNGSNS